MAISKERIEQIVVEGCLDDEKWQLAREVLRLKEEFRQLTKQYQDDLNDAARSAADEATWRAIQGEDYGSY